MKRLTVALGVEISVGRANIYLEELVNEPVDAVEYGLLSSVTKWDKPNMLPTLAFIKEQIADYYAAMQQRHLEHNTKLILAHTPKPADLPPPSYVRYYANAPMHIRDVMKTMSTPRAMEYAQQCGVRGDIISPGSPAAGLTAVAVDAIERGRSDRANGYQPDRDSDGQMGMRE